jgi:curli production assembly/transport component CsgE
MKSPATSNKQTIAKLVWALGLLMMPLTETARAEDEHSQEQKPTLSAPTANLTIVGKRSASHKIMLKGEMAAKVDETVQKLLEAVKKQQQGQRQHVTKIKSHPVDAQDFIDVGVLESPQLMEEGLEMGGIVTDDTVTRFGHDLFDAFEAAFKPPQDVSYNLHFEELNNAQRGSLITVKLNDMVIFEGFLMPRADAIEELGKGLARDIRTMLRNNAALEEEEYY